MTLRSFLDVAYTLLVEEYQRIGTDLLTALSKTEMYASGTPSTSPTAAPDPAAQNDAALRQFQTMMAGTGRV